MKYLASSAIAIALGLVTTLPTSAQADRNETYFTSSCQRTTERGEEDYRLMNQFSITIEDQPQKLYTAYYADGSPIVCLAKPDFTDATRVTDLPIEFLESVKPDPKTPNGFIFASAAGNGLELPIHYWGAVFTTNEPEIVDLNVGIHRGKLKPNQKVKHSFTGKAGQKMAIKLDSRAQARFTIVNSRGTKVITGGATSSPAITRANFALPANDTYQVIVASTSKSDVQSYTLSINQNQIPLDR
jgi:hypothetical protein